MTVSVIEEQPRMPKAILVATVVGLGAVSTISALAGYAIAPGSTKGEILIVSLAVMILVLLPYFLLRETVLESAKIPSPAALQVVHFYALMSWVAAAMVAWFNRRDIIQLTDNFHLLMLVAALAPFMYLYGRLTLSARNIKNEHRIFSRRVLVPSLFACVMPFLYGWAVALPGGFSVIVAITGALLIVWDLSSNSGNLKMHLVGLVVLLLLSTVLAYAVGPDFRALTFGCLMTLAMGATEVAKRVHLTAAGRIPAHPDESDDYYLKGANWSLIVFPLGLLFLPFLIGDFPAWAACAAAFVQIAGWGLLSTPVKRSKKAYWIAVAAGFSVPILVVVGTKFPEHQSLLQVDLLSTANLVFVTVIAIIAALNNQEKLKCFVQSLIKHETFLDDKNCRDFALFAILMCGLAVLIIGDVAPKISKDMVYSYKASDIEVFLLVLAAILYFRHPGSNDPPVEKSKPIIGYRKVPTENNKGSSGGVSTKSKTILILATARWPISLIAGVPVCAGLIVNGLHIWSAWLVGVSMTMSVAAAFLLNDYFDYKKDRLAEVDRPVSNGELSLASALVSGLFACVIAVLLAAVSALPGVVAVSVIVNIGVFLYSFISRWAPLLKGVVTATLCTTPFLFISVAIGDVWLTPSMLLLFTFVWGRELVMDAMDIHGDLLSGVHTLATVFGEYGARTLGWLAMIVSSMLLTFFMNGYSLIVSACCLFVILLARVMFQYDENLGILTSRASMLFGALAIAINVSS